MISLMLPKASALLFCHLWFVNCSTLLTIIWEPEKTNKLFTVVSLPRSILILGLYILLIIVSLKATLSANVGLFPLADMSNILAPLFSSLDARSMYIFQQPVGASLPTSFLILSTSCQTSSLSGAPYLYTRKLARTWPLINLIGRYSISCFPNLTTHFFIFPEALGLSRICLSPRLVKTYCMCMEISF